MPAHRALGLADAMASMPDWARVDWHMNESVVPLGNEESVPSIHDPERVAAVGCDLDYPSA